MFNGALVVDIIMLVPKRVLSLVFPEKNQHVLSDPQTRMTPPFLHLGSLARHPPRRDNMRMVRSMSRDVRRNRDELLGGNP